MLEAMDRSLRDIMKQSDKPFGGKIIILAGDFRQCLPVVPGQSKACIIKHSIIKSYLWDFFEVHELSINMRVRASGDKILEDFDNWTLSIGNGESSSFDKSDMIQIPEELCLKIVV